MEYPQRIRGGHHLLPFLDHSGNSRFARYPGLAQAAPVPVEMIMRFHVVGGCGSKVADALDNHILLPRAGLSTRGNRWGNGETMSNLLNENVTSQIREVFSNLKNDVQLMLFFRSHDCEYCDDAKQLMEEVTALSDKLSLSTYDLDAETEIAQRYQMENAPGIVIAAKDGAAVTDLGIRYAGIPSGHEFSSFIQDIILASARDSGLSAGTRAFLQTLTKPVHLQVFVTPT